MTAPEFLNEQLALIRWTVFAKTLEKQRLVLSFPGCTWECSSSAKLSFADERVPKYNLGTRKRELLR